MNHAVKMIVTDLDGTLLRTDKSISEQTRQTLSRCRKEGIKVVYATGRGGSVKSIVSNEFFDGRISMNGAIAKDNDTIIYNRLIPNQISRPVLMACNQKGINVTSEISGMHYSNFVVTDFWPLTTNFKIVDFSHHEIDAEKIYTPNPTDEEISFIERMLPDDLYFVATSDMTANRGVLGQIMHKDATKAKAIAALAQHWGILQSEIVAFGDDFNDIDMLSYAGIGVAMKNAVDEVKAVSDFICLSNDEDGLALWVRENVLKLEEGDAKA